MKNKFQIPSCQECPSRKSSILDDLSQEDLDKISDVKGCNFFKKGQIIFQEGNHASGIYCIHSGKIKLYRRGAEGKEQIIRFAKDGDIIGYRSILSTEPLSASASALEDTAVCFIPKSFFFEFISNNPKFTMDLMKMACHELGEASKIITNLAQKSVRERLAEVLLILHSTFGADKDNILDVTLTREELANMVGTATESVIRLLSEFKKDKLIAMKGKSIQLLDMKGLAHTGNVYD